MSQPGRVQAFRPVVTVDDWKMIISAIQAYSHNADYRDLLGRLEHEAMLNGITELRRQPAPPEVWDRQ